MPGLRKDVDSSPWKESDWWFAKTWNVVFLVGWVAFFSLSLRAQVELANYYILIPTLLTAVIGFVIQFIWLLRITISLDNQKNSKSGR